jgi:hypothetical protein
MLERELRRNPHYAWCVDLRQLRPARVVRVAPGADRVYVNACVAKGRRIGDVKPVWLHRECGWEARLGALECEDMSSPGAGPGAGGPGTG